MRQFLLICAFVLLLRLPFLNQAIQGDDYYYLAAAQWAQIDPLHPHHARYVFLGDVISMRGHPHPPGNAWVLAGLLALWGGIYEVRFHAAYIAFSLLAAWGTWRLARRFVPERALQATLLFCAVPAFVVNGTSLEADLPFLAFWMASIALFVERRLILAAAALACCALMAYQSVVVIPILALYLWWRRRSDLASWLLLLVPVAVLAAYQLMERMAAGAMPAAVLAGHFEAYQLQTLTMKLKNAVALTGHLVMMLSPLGFAGLILAFRRRVEPWLLGWVVIFFAAALVLFFAGSARYLLPLAAPFAILAASVWRDRPALLWACLAMQLTTGLSLAWINYQHWDAYREFARLVARQTAGRRVWVNGEWGLRYYAEANGALPLKRGQMIQPGEFLVTSELSGGVPFTAGGGALVPSDTTEIKPTLPLRLIGTGSGSGYSSVVFGLWPFGFSRAPVDRLTLSAVVARTPQLSWLPMNAAHAGDQIVSGAYGLEQGEWRWISGRASFLLKNPGAPRKLVAEIFVPGASPARAFRLAVDGADVASITVAGEGKHTLETPPLRPAGETVTVTIIADKDFSPPGDNRRLSVILSAIGFRE